MNLSQVAAAVALVLCNLLLLLNKVSCEELGLPADNESFIVELDVSSQSASHLDIDLLLESSLTSDGNGSSHAESNLASEKPGHEFDGPSSAPGASPSSLNASANSDQTEQSSEGIQSQPFVAKIVSIFIKGDQLQLSYDYRLTKPAIDIAVERVNSLYSPYVRFQVTHRTGYNDCDHNFAGAYAAEEHLTQGRVSLFVGPACPSALDSVARLASYWNIPICTVGGLSSQFDNNSAFSTLIRLSVTTSGISGAFWAIMKHFKWHHVVVLTDVEHQISELIKNALQQAFVFKAHDDYQFEAKFEDFNFKREGNNFTDLLLRASQSARRDVVRDVLLEAHRQGMGHGNFAFLSVELFKSKRFFGDFSWHRPRDPANKVARTVYESLMIISLRVPLAERYLGFKSEVVQRAREEFDVTIERADVSSMIAEFHDCIMMYASALNITLAAGKDPHDGFSTIRRLWNSTFTTGVHGDIYINEQGDREADYTLNDFDPETQEMAPVAYYCGQEDALDVVAEPLWPGGIGSPPDMPTCGFSGRDCHRSGHWALKRLTITTLIIVALISLTFPAIFFLHRRFQVQAELHNFWWKIGWDEINFLDRSMSTTSGGSGQGSSFVDMDTAEEAYDGPESRSRLGTGLATALPSNFKRRFRVDSLANGTRLANYKNMKVAVKTLKLQRLPINNSVLVELKQIRSLTHENLIRIIGLCVDEPNFSLITELCPRGNLQDLILNDSFHLDWSFRYSIINDLVEGLSFVHSSPIAFHGRLRSTNCLIDSRFVVKLTDVGLGFIYNNVKQEDANVRRLMWTAPEHLRAKISLGSAKGDVYSFGIILQEIITRSEPFECEPMLFNPSTMITSKASLTPEEVLNLVRMGLDPPFRPFLPQVSEEVPRELLDLIGKCWREDPLERPSFPNVKLMLKGLCKSYGRNLLDNLLHRMERYTDNLEQLVQEKTSALVEEKKKCDDLLNELLPKCVVNQLKSGQHVQPEHYDCVTICFIDIVGFTRIAAKCSPIQVIDLLNLLYTAFDTTIAAYDVYKVETIGDAYMVVSGLPERNGSNHVREVARLSLALVEKIKHFRVRHLPGVSLRLRVGMHSGPCAAGVVGTKMPRYCLFGDSVNTASRMESHGEAMQIHVSEESKHLLDTFHSFTVVERGQVDIKGKGKLTTYWLINEKNTLS